MISSLKTAIGYNTDGTQKRFMFPNALIKGDHLEITLNDIPVSSGFTVTLETNRDLGAVVEFTTAPATGQVLVISRATPITQEETFTAGSNFPGDTFERALDKLTMIIQERGFVCGDCVPLGAPIILSATAVGIDQIDLVWSDNSTDETGFEIQRSLDGSTGWATVASPAANATTHSDTGITDGTKFFYRIRAVGGVLESEWSNVVNATTAVAAPSGLTATQTGTTTLDLVWTDNSASETSLEVQRSLDGSTGWTTVLTPAANATTASDSGLTEGTQYFYRIRAKNATGDSAWSSTANDFTLPAAPSSLVATAISDTEIDLTWVDNSGSETSFSIERSLDGSTGWTEVLTPAANATSASDTGLTAETEYFYRIKALRSGDSSAYSNTDSATTESALPPLLAHYDADSFADGATWQDETANGHDLTKHGNPVNITGFNGTAHDAVDFDGDGDYFRITSLPGGLLEEDDGECTVFFVARFNAGNKSLLMSTKEPPRVEFGFPSTGGSFTLRRNSDGANSVFTTVAGVSTGYAIAGFRVNANEVIVRVNANEAFNDTSPGSMSDASEWTFGTLAAFPDGANAFNGEMANIEVFQGVMTDAQWAAKFVELGAEYGIVVETTPTTPANIQVSVVSSSQLNVSWDNDSITGTTYEIERSLDGVGGWALIDTVPTEPGQSSIVYNDTGLSAATEYFYRVRATNSVGTSAYSVVDSATTQA